MSKDDIMVVKDLIVKDDASSAIRNVPSSNNTGLQQSWDDHQMDDLVDASSVISNVPSSRSFASLQHSWDELEKHLKKKPTRPPAADRLLPRPTLQPRAAVLLLLPCDHQGQHYFRLGLH